MPLSRADARRVLQPRNSIEDLPRKVKVECRQSFGNPSQTAGGPRMALVQRRRAFKTLSPRLEFWWRRPMPKVPGTTGGISAGLFLVFLEPQSLLHSTSLGCKPAATSPAGSCATSGELVQSRSVLGLTKGHFFGNLGRLLGFEALHSPSTRYEVTLFQYLVSYYRMDEAHAQVGIPISGRLLAIFPAQFGWQVLAELRGSRVSVDMA